MRRALSPEGRARLARCLRQGALLAFDFDGTLAPITAEPRRARMRPRTRSLLARLASKHPCLVLSGRGLADLERRLSGIELVELVGNHGATRRSGPRTSARALERCAAWRAELERRLASHRGVTIEDNGASLSVHYRKAHDRNAARRAILRSVGFLDGARALAGKCVVNVLPAEAPDKGQVLAAICRRRRMRAAMYVGDDVTDEAAFAAPVAACYATVRVGRSQTSAASHFLEHQEGIDELLEFLLRASP